MIRSDYLRAIEFQIENDISLWPARKSYLIEQYIKESNELLDSLEKKDYLSDFMKSLIKSEEKNRVKKFKRILKKIHENN